MSTSRELTSRLVSTLQELKREMQYRGPKDYVQNLKKKEYLNGKESFTLPGATAYLNLSSPRK